MLQPEIGKLSCEGARSFKSGLDAERLLCPFVDPILYSFTAPNFRTLAAKYSSTFGSL